MSTRAFVVSARLIAAITPALLGTCAFANPGTAFTYQGSLAQGGVPATGPHDLQFRLMDSVAGGSQVGPALCVDDLAIINGLFTVSLDFGQVFTFGNALHLEISVRQDAGAPCGSGGAFTTLEPRQTLAITPFAGYAINARTATSADFATDAAALDGQGSTFFRNAGNLNTGTIPDARLSSNVPRFNSSGTFTGAITLSSPLNSISGNGVNLSSLNASALVTGTIPQAVLQGTYPNALSFTNSSNTYFGSGAGLSSLNAGSLTIGVIPPAVLTGTYSNVITLSNSSNSFSGSGAGLTSLNASSLSTGAVPNARFLGNYTNIITMNNALNTLGGDGAAITNLNAGNLASGTLPGARLSGTYSSAVTLNNASNQFSGTGTGLTALNASSVTTGTLNDARLSLNVALENTANTFTQACNFTNSATFSGPLNASSITLTTPAVRVYSIGRFDFLPGEETGESDNPAINATLSARRYAAAVHLPQDAIVTALRITGADAATGDMTAYLLRRWHDGIGGGTMAQVSSTGSAGSVLTWTDSTIGSGTIDNNTYQYIIRLDTPSVSSGSCSMRSIRIEYTVTEPLP